MPAAPFLPALNQVAFSVIDLERTEAWFHDGLGFLPAGGSIFLMSSPVAGRVQGIPGAASCCWWMVGRNNWFQLELFQFRQPKAKLLPEDFRPCDIGYTRIGVHVLDFDGTLANLAALGTEPVAPVVGDAGQRRACVRSPDGVFVEIMEDDPLPQPAGSERPGCGVAIRSVTLSTPDLESSVAYLAAINGHGLSDIRLHDDAHEAAWGLPSAQCKRAVFESGDVLVEVVQYSDPPGKPWPEGYRICDQGILNIAYGARCKADHMEVFARAEAFGARPNWKPFHFDNAGVVYLNDALRFSVEILWLPKGSREQKYGFAPLPRHRRPQPDKFRIAGKVAIRAPAAHVWAILCDQPGMSKWIGFDSVKRTRDGFTSPDGRGSERLLQGKPGTILEQVTGIEEGKAIRYRVLSGGPIDFHNGEIRLHPQGDGCVVEWSIRARSKLPFTNGLLRFGMQKMLDRMLQTGLKPRAENSFARGKQAHATA